MKKRFVIGYCSLVLALLGAAAFITGRVDPFFHYHAPDTETYFYTLNNQRSQNDGILRRFPYEGIITGTSMTENFKTSEAQELFGVPFVKIPFSGGSFKEVEENLTAAAARNPDLTIVIRGLDMAKFFDDKDQMRTDLGAFPTYLYDGDPFNDVEYLFNRDVLFSRIYPMIKARRDPEFTPGITSFDDYSNWMRKYPFGPKTVLSGGLKTGTADPVPLTGAEADRIRANIRQNVTALAEKHPEITFYYFFPPYSAAWWQAQLAAGKLDRQIEAERIVIEELLACGSIRLFSFNCLFDITTELNHYKDTTHYGEWVNSLMLRYMAEDKCRLTADNYGEYLERERQFYSSFDYTLLTLQEDLANDRDAQALLP